MLFGLANNFLHYKFLIQFLKIFLFNPGFEKNYISNENNRKSINNNFFICVRSSNFKIY